jgi:hypothetical protein
MFYSLLIPGMWFCLFPPEAAVKAQQAAAAQVLKPLPPSSTPTLNFLQSAGNTASPPQFRKVAISSRLPPSMPAGGSPLLINLATSGAQPGAMRVIPSQLKPQSTATGRIVNVNVSYYYNVIVYFIFFSHKQSHGLLQQPDYRTWRF